MSGSSEGREDFLFDVFEDELPEDEAYQNPPLFDLGRFLPEHEFYDLIHANLSGSKTALRRVAQFVRETDAMRQGIGGSA